MIGISWKNHKVNPDLYDMRGNGRYSKYPEGS